MRRLTVSGLGRASHCLYWLREDVPHEDVPSAARELGNAFHERAAARINGRPCAVVGELGAALEAASLEALDMQPGKRAEVAYAFDPAASTARELGVDIGRAYDERGARPGEICGSADVVTPRYGGGVSVTVDDWKTGQDCGPAQTSTQLRALASMAALAGGVGHAIVRYRYVSEDGVRDEEAELDDFALRQVIPLELVVLADAVREEGPTSLPEPGSWCEYCPAFGHCPAQRAMVEAAAPAHARHLPVLQDATAAITSPDAAAQIIASLNALDGLVKIWWHKLDEYADACGPIDVGGGKFYKGWDETRESIVVDEPAELALLEHFGAAYKSLIERSITKSAIEAHAATVAAKGKKAEMVRAVMASLRTAGSTRPKVIRKHGVK